MTEEKYALSESVFRLLSILAVFFAAPFLAATPAHASVSCAVNSASISFGPASTATGTIFYTCTASAVEILPTVNLCAYPGTPSAPGTIAQPRLASGANSLAFNLYRDASRSVIWSQANPATASFTIPATGLGGSISGTLTFHGAIPAGQNPVPATYVGSFANSVIGFSTANGCQRNHTVLLSAYSGQNFNLTASAEVAKACTVLATGDADLGNAAAGSGAVNGSSAITVSCTNTTPYFIGLLPSNGDPAGLGELSGTGANIDRPNYQLRFGSVTGPVWGNIGSVESVGNGTSGIGSGSTQTYPVYVTVPDTNYTPDNYSDTVTVIINY